MRAEERLPDPTDLMDYPQLAILAALDTTLNAAICALVAAHPHMGAVDITIPRQEIRLHNMADRVIHHACNLESAVEYYRAAIEEELYPYGKEDF
jgi:hypothetical protein